MTGQGLLQLALYVVVLVALVKPLGAFMAAVFQGERTFMSPLLGPVERLIYRVAGVDPAHESDWKRYLLGALLVNLLGFIAVFALQRLQGVLPLNPQGLAAVSPDSSFNTAVSFATNTNWQGYAGEATMSYLTQMLGLAVQNFLSAATGIAVLVALIRGFVRREAGQIGNFWVDFTRSTLYVLLPLSFILAVVLATQGVVQSFSPYAQATLVEPVVMQDQTVTEQTLPLGPAASQVAIKQLGTNGGGFFNVNSAHPFENPTPLSNFLEVLAILLIPAALCYTFGSMVNDKRQGWALLAAMLVIFVPLLVGAFAAEQAGNPRFDALGVDQAPSAMQPGGNMEGKETRFGIANSALWATATTAASNGSVNSMHDSFTPLGGLVPMWLMQLGEVVFGGVGSGLYGMLMFAIIAVFIAGTDGRAHARIPRQEDRGLRGQDGGDRAAGAVPGGPARHRRGGHGAGGHRECRQSRRARVLGDPVCVFVRRQQQRQRLRGSLGQHALLQFRARHRDVGVALLADDSGPGHRRQPRRQACDCRHGGHLAHAHAAFRHLAGDHGAAGRRTHLPAGARARADRGTPPASWEPLR